MRGIIPYIKDKAILKTEGLEELQREFLYLKKKGATELREFYFVPSELCRSEVEITTFNDVVMIVSYRYNVVTVITGAPFANALRSLFLFALRSAREQESSIFNEYDRKFLETVK